MSVASAPPVFEAPAPAGVQIAAPVRLAQATPPLRPAQKSAPSTVEGVVVTGAASEVTTSIDRHSYSLGKDIAATSGSIADALRNVPSVSVDPEGVLSLRGDTNVTILIDGKPSGAFEGRGRADALAQFPADQVARVEVITNPSAAMNPEGSGGVINLITKPSKGSGWTGSAYATAGSAGLKKAGLNFGYNSAKLSITGSLAGNYQHTKNQLDEIRTSIVPATGVRLDHSGRTIGKNLSRGPTARVTVGYAVTPKDQLTATLNGNDVLIYGYPFIHFDDRNAAGAITGFQDRQGKRRFSQNNAGLSGGWRHTFGEGHTLSLDLVRNQTDFSDHVFYTTLASLPAVAPFERTRLDADATHSEIRLSYARPMAGGAKFSAGFEHKVDDNAFVAEVGRGAAPSALTADPSVSFLYDFGQTIDAAYATYERAFGDLSLQGGLRVEQAAADIDERTSGQHFTPDYLRAYPTLHLSYRLNDEAKLTASYSTRVQRPPAFLLNPFTVYADPKSFQQGNPNLKPQETQAFETGYEMRRKGATYMATAYYRRNKDEFSPIVRDQSGGVLLVTFDNLGSSRTAGLDLVASGKLTKTLSYNATLGPFWKQIDPGNVSAGGELSSYGVSGRINLDWQATPKDALQINANNPGRRLFAQGVVDSYWTVNLGWRRKITDKVTLTVSAQDLFDQNRNRRLLETATLRDDANFRPVSRGLSLRLDYRFGAKPKAGSDPAFDYGSAAPGL